MSTEPKKPFWPTRAEAARVIWVLACCGAVGLALDPLRMRLASWGVTSDLVRTLLAVIAIWLPLALFDRLVARRLFPRTSLAPDRSGEPPT